MFRNIEEGQYKCSDIHYAWSRWE